MNNRINNVAPGDIFEDRGYKVEAVEPHGRKCHLCCYNGEFPAKRTKRGYLRGCTMPKELDNCMYGNYYCRVIGRVEEDKPKTDFR